MCVQYRGGCSVPWGDIMMNVGDILSTVGDILSTVGGYLEYRGGVQYHGGDIMMHVRGYHESCGRCSVPWRGGGEFFFYLSTPRYWTPPMVLMISPTCIMIPSTVLKFQRMVSPHGTHDIPHVHHDIPHGTQSSVQLILHMHCSRSFWGQVGGTPM